MLAGVLSCPYREKSCVCVVPVVIFIALSGVLDLNNSLRKRLLCGKTKPSITCSLSRALQGGTHWVVEASFGRESPLSWRTRSTCGGRRTDALQESHCHSAVARPPPVGVGIFSFARYGGDFYSSSYKGKVKAPQRPSLRDYSVFDDHYTPEVTSVLLLRSCKVGRLQI